MKRFLKYDTEDAKNGVGPVDKNGVIKKDISGGGMQPDWNQNDEAAADYVKNRPFYEEVDEIANLNDTTEGFTVVGDFIKINDRCISPDDIDENTVYTAVENGELREFIGMLSPTDITDAIGSDISDTIAIMGVMLPGVTGDIPMPYFLVVYESTSFGGLNYDETGTYMSVLLYESGIRKIVNKKPKPIAPKYLPTPLIIDATHLPTDNSGWGELYEKIDSAYKDRIEILLDVYGDYSSILPCVSWRSSIATFIYAKGDSTLCVYILTALPNDGGSLEKRIIAMQEEVS